MAQTLRFMDKTVIVTGAAQGIGRGVALRMAQEGARVVIVDRSDYLDSVYEEILANQAQVIKVKADLETAAGALAVVAQALKAYDRIDVLVNNVGGAIWMKPFEAFTADEISQEISRSLFPTLWCCHAVLPTMIKQQHGVIVNVSSVATRGIHRVPYSAAKGGVNALTASLAFEHAKDGIRVNAVATGGTDAPPRKVPRNPAQQSEQEKAWMDAVVKQTVDRTFLGRYGTIEEQVEAILFLASDAASYITGTVLPVGGGDQG